MQMSYVVRVKYYGDKLYFVTWIQVLYPQSKVYTDLFCLYLVLSVIVPGVHFVPSTRDHSLFFLSCLVLLLLLLLLLLLFIISGPLAQQIKSQVHEPPDENKIHAVQREMC